MKLRKVYLRVRYWRQLRKGFKLLKDEPKEFIIINDRAILMNSKDPLVQVNLTSHKVTQYTPIKERRKALLWH